MEPLLYVFRIKSGGKAEYVGSTQTPESARELVISKASEPTERFAIYNVLTHEITYLSANELIDQNSSLPRTSSSAVSPESRAKRPK